MGCFPDEIEPVHGWGWVIHWGCGVSENTVLDPVEAMRTHLCESDVPNEVPVPPVRDLIGSGRVEGEHIDMPRSPLQVQQKSQKGAPDSDRVTLPSNNRKVTR